MNNSDQLLTILPFCFTKESLQRRLRLLRAYLELTHFTSSKATLNEFLQKNNANEGDAKVLTLMREKLGRALTPKTAQNILGTLTKQAQNLPTIHLYTPYILSLDVAQKIGTWFKKNVGPTTLLDLHVDPTLSIGCLLVVGGVAYDYSLKSFLNSQRSQIREILKAFSKQDGQQASTIKSIKS